MESDSKDIDLKRIEIEATMPKDQSGPIEVKGRIICEKCVKGKHNECIPLGCACAKNNHSQAY